MLASPLWDGSARRLLGSMLAIGLFAAYTASASERLFSLEEAAFQPTEKRDVESEPSPKPAPPAVNSASGQVPSSFLLSSERMHDDPEVLWPGFLTGLRGFDHFYEPIGNPLYFESPFVNTSLKLLYLYHEFPDGSQIGGGDLNVYAVQARVALTERWAFLATKDGYSDLEAGILPQEEGWNNIAIGTKYALLVDRDNDFVLTPGIRWEWTNGDEDVLQAHSQELSPFLSVAKGFDRLHVLGNLTGRLPMDHNDGNYIVSWDVHFDYEVSPEHLPGFAPVLEFHGLHYLSDGDRLPLSIGGLDYTQLGSEDVAGDSVYWSGVGFRWKLTPHASVGTTWEFPLSSADDDIMGQRVTADLTLTW